MENISHTRGDTFKRQVIFQQEDGTPVDITGSTITFSLKVNISDTVALITSPVTITNGPGGLAEINVSNTLMEIDLQNYYYDVQWVDSSGVVKTVLKGGFAITYDITN